MDKKELERKQRSDAEDDYILPLDGPMRWLRPNTPEDIAFRRSRLTRSRLGPPGVKAIFEEDIDPRPATPQQAKPKKPKRPKWLPSSYHARALTQVGADALADLGPDGPGILGYPTSPMKSLQERRDMLAARYAAHDMIRLGHAVEVRGAYYFRKDSKDGADHLADAFKRMQRSDGQMDLYEMGKWLAVYRMATLDQIFTLDPENEFNNFQLLSEMEDRGFAIRSQVRFGKGRIDIWSLGPDLWGDLKSRYSEMETRGFGPLPPAMIRPNGMVNTGGRRNVFLHPLLQVDAIQWFIHEAELNQNVVKALMLERYLRRNGENEPGHRYLDFRLMIQGPFGASLPTDVEVIGLGSQYRSREKKAYIRSSSIVHKSFSSTPHKIELLNHVCIGR